MFSHKTLERTMLGFALLAMLAIVIACTAPPAAQPTAAPPTAAPVTQPTAAPVTQPTAPPAAAKAKLQIIWFCWGPQQALADLVKKYDKAEVEVRCVDVNQWHDQTFTDFAAKGGADLAVLDSQWMGEAVTGGHIVDMTDWIAANVNKDDFVPAALSAYAEYPPGSNKLYALPAIADTHMLIYRKDLYADPKVQADYKAATSQDLRVPTTWEELLKQAQFFKNSGGKYGVQNGYSAIWRGKGGYDEIATEVNQILWSHGGELWDPKTYKVEGVLNSPENVKGLTLAAELFKTSPDGAGNFSFGEMIDALCNGSTAIGNVWFAFGATFADEKSCKEAKNLSFGVVPGQDKHVLSLGGQGMSVSAYSKNKDAALAFLKWFETPEIQAEWVKYPGNFSARKDITGSTAFKGVTAFNPFFSDSFPLVRDFWNLPEYAGMLPLMQEYFNLAVTGETSPKEALDTIAKGQQAILDKAYPNGPPK